MNDEYGYVKFLGDYSKLKSMGFTFQKLFAGNYMQWSRDGFRVWKKGSDITHDRVNLFKLIRFLRTEQVVRQSDKFITFFKFYTDEENNIYDYYPLTDENIKKMNDNRKLWSADNYDENNPPPHLGEYEHFKIKDLELLREFKEMGWYELDYYPED
jgi:hypothetical protein